MSKLLAKTILVAGLNDAAQVSMKITQTMEDYRIYKDMFPISKKDVGRPYVAPKYDSERNDPCPCGSGLKFKKCCINLKGE